VLLDTKSFFFTFLLTIPNITYVCIILFKNHENSLIAREKNIIYQLFVVFLGQNHHQLNQ